MELIRNTEFFQGEGENFRYKENIILYTDGTNLFQARTTTRYKDDEIKFSELQGSCIPEECIYPPFDSDLFIVAPDPIPSDCYLKRPNLLFYCADDVRELYIVSELLQEAARICQELLKSPHRNIASYMGCQVRDGRIVRLCFKRYTETIFERVERSPGQINKRQCLEDIRRGINHLHSLDYCHNDINPGNIMFDEHDVAAIIDFDSARSVGQERSYKAGTPGYLKTDVTHSNKENDYYGLSKIEEFLDKNCNLKKTSKEEPENPPTYYKKVYEPTDKVDCPYFSKLDLAAAEPLDLTTMRKLANKMHHDRARQRNRAESAEKKAEREKNMREMAEKRAAGLEEGTRRLRVQRSQKELIIDH